MKWFVFVCVALCLRHGEGGALKCIPGTQDHSCSTDLKGKELPTQTSIGDSQGSSSELECRPASEWESNCHSCKCTESGRAHCQKKDVCESDILGEPTKCKPLTSFKYGGKICGCTDIGQLLCSPSTESNVPRAESDPNEESLVPTFDRDRNIDVELNLIDNGIHGYHYIFKRSLCRPNQEFKADCNTCKCSPTGGSYKCTQNECMEEDNLKEVEVFSVGPGVDHVERQTICRPRAIFHISCNTCRCNYDGTDYSCTENPCPIPQDVELIRELKVTRSILSPSKSVVCVANRMFIKDCNTCWCNEDGTSYFCTRRVCVEENPDGNREGDNSEKPRVNEKRCVPNAEFKKDCNTCTCNEEGTSYSCTRMECYEEKRPPINENQCVPNKEFMIDCNTCTCNKEGTSYICTRVECHEEKRPRLNENQCVPNEVFKIDCNTCTCNKEGTSYSCTRMECYEEKRPRINENQCVPNEVFKIDCNTCTCNKEGTSYSCTRMRCLIEKSPRINENQCVPNQIFKVDCNTCTCDKDGTSYTCTKMECVDEKRPRTNQCVPDEVIKKDCNTCTCNEDGMSYSCTRMECTESLTLSRKTRALQQDPPKTCQPGQEFRMDCNKCLCDNEGQDFSCTRIDCDAANNHEAGIFTQVRTKRARPGAPRAMNNPIPSPGRVRPEDYERYLQQVAGNSLRQKREVDKVSVECTPDEIFARGCNMCRCSPDGRMATCTIKNCAKDKDSVTDQPVTDLDPSFRCNAGEQFKQDCKDCTCSADGKSVFCTLRLCDENGTPDIQI